MKFIASKLFNHEKDIRHFPSLLIKTAKGTKLALSTLHKRFTADVRQIILLKSVHDVTVTSIIIKAMEIVNVRELGQIIELC